MVMLVKQLPPHSRRRGFTLVELAIVILIIGLLFAFILAASWGSVEQARVRATQALITKLEVGVNERLNAILTQSVAPNGWHQLIASNRDLKNGFIIPSPVRAEVLVRVDQVRAELPDVFFVQQDPLYPINFGGLPFPQANPLLPGAWQIAPGAFSNIPYYAPYALPMGTAYSYSDANNVVQWVGSPGPGAGIFGATYTARAALYKSIGLSPICTDAADNDGNGLVDDAGEFSAADGATMTNFIANHQHHTARSELLYALLMNGSGPLGSVFEASEFRQGVEVKDTDNDGAPEFVDAWGQPIQFFRWPIYYYSTAVQKGAGLYSGYETRARFSLDPASQLVGPAWWSIYTANNGNGPFPISPIPQQFFEPFFTSLSDPNWVSGTSPQPTAWDFSGLYPRREFGCKFLILSAGPDQQFGVALLDDQLVRGTAASPDLLSHWLNGVPNPTGSVLHAGVKRLNNNSGVIGENYAILRNGYPLINTDLIDANLPMNPQDQPLNPPLPGKVFPQTQPPDVASDDISNHELLSQGGGLR